MPFFLSNSIVVLALVAYCKAATQNFWHCKVSYNVQAMLLLKDLVYNKTLATLTVISDILLVNTHLTLPPYHCCYGFGNEI